MNPTHGLKFPISIINCATVLAGQELVQSHFLFVILICDF